MVDIFVCKITGTVTQLLKSWQLIFFWFDLSVSCFIVAAPNNRKSDTPFLSTEHDVDG